MWTCDTFSRDYCNFSDRKSLSISLGDCISLTGMCAHANDNWELFVQLPTVWHFVYSNLPIMKHALVHGYIFRYTQYFQSPFIHWAREEGFVFNYPYFIHRAGNQKIEFTVSKKIFYGTAVGFPLSTWLSVIGQRNCMIVTALIDIGCCSYRHVCEGWITQGVNFTLFTFSIAIHSV